MNTDAQRFAFIALALISCSAFASRHHVCFEDESIAGQMTGVFGCHDDAGGYCVVERPLSAGSTEIHAFPRPAQGAYRKFQFSQWATYQANIKFFNAGNASQMPDETRTCKINGQSSSRGAASPGAELTGFTTDASGLVTTAVWKWSRRSHPERRCKL